YVPGLSVKDRPALGLRGVSDDLSRGQISTLDDLKALVRLLARYKLNLYMPYLEDMFALDGRPEFGDGRGALTPAEARELAGYAAGFHVRVVPIFQTLGHYENALLEPAFSGMAEFPGAQCLSPALEQTYVFLKDALAQAAAAFDDPFFHAGCDESWDVGRGASRQMAGKLGLAGTHAAHYDRVHGLLAGLGKRMLMYGDILLGQPSILAHLPRDIVIVDWHYEAARRYPSVKKFRGAGFDVVVSPSVRNYNRLYPDWDGALTNIEYLTREGIESGALGSLVSSWCDNGAFSLRQFNLWGYAFAAAVSWNPAEVDREGIERAFWRSFTGVADPAGLVEANRLLASLGRGSTLYDWWRHPLLGTSTSGPVGVKGDPGRVGEKLAESMQRAGELIESGRRSATANLWYFDMLSFAAGCGAALAEKYLWNAGYEAAVRGNLTAGQVKALRSRALDLHRKMSGIRRDYQRLWLSVNRPEGLENNLGLLDRQIDAWVEAVQSLTVGDLPQPADLGSRWLAPAGSSVRGRSKSIRRSFFRYGFTLPDSLPAEKALMQLMAAGHGRLWINGESVGEVVARRSLSLIVELQRAKIFEVTSRLRPGVNELAAEVDNYEGGVPAVNVYGEIFDSAGVVVSTVQSRDGWRGVEASAEPAGWRDSSFNDKSWKPCEKYRLGARVSRPELARGKNSLIQR
ncbi:MAG: family 20 glycosylhydrolase, partial [Candidatus Glassbacteria bacterium]